MRLMKLLLVLVAVVVAGSWSDVRAQQACGAINNSQRDTIRVLNFTGRPGDTVFMPVYFRTDSLIAGFQCILTVDTNFLRPTGISVDTFFDTIQTTPTLIVDTLVQAFVDNNLVGRLLSVQNHFDANYPGQVALITEFSQNPFDSGALLATYIPPLIAAGDPLSLIDFGGDVLFNMPFVVNPSMQDGDTAVITFQQADQFFIDSTGAQIPTGCRRSQIASAWRNPGGTTNPTLYPTLRFGVFTADTNPPPSINAFGGAPATITQAGGFSLLAWNVSNADSITISAGASRIYGTTNLVSDTVVTPTVTTVYTLTAYNSSGTSTLTTTVTVNITGGGGGGGGGGTINLRPEITFIPNTETVTLDQFQDLVLIVEANDSNGDSVILEAQGTLPAGAAFSGSPTNGFGTHRRTFTFTPTDTQLGAYQVIFTARDRFNASSAKYLTIIVERLTDKLSTTSDTTIGRRPVGGLPGTTQILVPINLSTTQSMYGVQFDLTFDSLNVEVDSFVTTARTPGFTVFDNIGVLEGLVRVDIFDLQNDSILRDTIPIVYAAVTVDSFAPPGLYELCLKNGFGSIDPNPNTPGIPIDVACGVLQIDRLGDMNLDRNVNVADVVSTIGVILGTQTANPRQFAAGNTVAGVAIDVFDMVGILNIIFGLPLNPAAGIEIPDVFAELSLAYNGLSQGEGDYLRLEAEIPTDVAAVEFDIQYDPSAVSIFAPEKGSDAGNLEITSRSNGAGRMRVVVFSSNVTQSSRNLHPGKNEVIKFPMVARKALTPGDESQIRISRALLSTPTGRAVRVNGATGGNLPSGFTLRQNYPNPFNPTTTIEFSIDGGELGLQDVRLDIFNILGQRVNTLIDGPMSAGTYRHEWDARNYRGDKVATGVYLYRLQVGEGFQTKKMIFLK